MEMKTNPNSKYNNQNILHLFLYHKADTVKEILLNFLLNGLIIDKNELISLLSSHKDSNQIVVDFENRNFWDVSSDFQNLPQKIKSIIFTLIISFKTILKYSPFKMSKYVYYIIINYLFSSLIFPNPNFDKFSELIKLVGDFKNKEMKEKSGKYEEIINSLNERIKKDYFFFKNIINEKEKMIINLKEENERLKKLN